MVVLSQSHLDDSAAVVMDDSGSLENEVRIC